MRVYRTSGAHVQFLGQGIRYIGCAGINFYGKTS